MPCLTSMRPLDAGARQGVSDPAGTAGQDLCCLRTPNQVRPPSLTDAPRRLPLSPTASMRVYDLLLPHGDRGCTALRCFSTVPPSHGKSQ